MNDFYVYAHIRLNDGSTFYVGKGKDRRAYKRGSYRNKHWNRVSKKYGYRVEFLETNLSESQAFKLEAFWISKLKNINQCECNYSLGGEGNSGYKFTKSQKSNLSKIQKSGSFKILEGHKKQAIQIKGRTKETHQGILTISKKNSGIGNGRAIFNVITPDGTFTTIKETSVFYKISTATVHGRIKNPKFNWYKVLK